MKSSTATQKDYFQSNLFFIILVVAGIIYRSILFTFSKLFFKLPNSDQTIFDQSLQESQIEKRKIEKSQREKVLSSK